MSMKQKVPIIGCLLLLGSRMLAQAPASTTTHPAVEVIKATAPDASKLKARKGSYSFKIESGDWTDTGVPVTPSDHLNFTATGNLALADGRSGPARWPHPGMERPAPRVPIKLRQQRRSDRPYR